MLKPFPTRASEPTTKCQKCFWELIGVRIEGMKDVLLGAVKFQRQAEGSVARRALSQYLSSPASPLDTHSADYPSHLLKLALRPSTTALTDFVSGLNRGEEPKVALIDLEMVQLCFDFRRENPSIEKSRFSNIGSKKMCLRSVEGHVVTGTMHSPLKSLRREDRFLGLSGVVQHSGIGELQMPDLIANRSFFSVAAECQGGALPAQVFQPATDAVQPLIGLAAWRYFMARRNVAQDQVVERVEDQAWAV